MSSKTALVGEPPSYIPFSNIFDFVYSNPFQAGSEALKQAPSKQSKDRTIPRIDPSKPYLVDPVQGSSLSFGRSREDALKVAAGLQEILGPGSKTQDGGQPPVVLLHLPNCLEFAPLLLGVFASGFTATMANVALTSGELDWILQLSKPAAIVTTPAGWKQLNSAISNLEDVEHKKLLCGGDRLYIVDPSKTYSNHEGLKQASPKGTRPWTELAGSKPLEKGMQLTEAQSRERTALILWSSGTSGKSKGVRLNHIAVTSTLVSVWHVNDRYDENERWLGLVPYFHIFGLINELLLAPCIGATIYNMQKFEPNQMLDTIQKQKITFLHVAPPVALLLAKSPMVKGKDLRSLKAVITGGAPLGTDAIEAVYKRLGLLVLMGYGLSEGGVVCQNDAKDFTALKPQLGSVGNPVYGVEVKVISTEDSKKTLNIGETGEILVRSPAIMQGYLKNKEATDESLDSEGWFHSGDVGQIDDSSRLWVTDRLKEVIKVKGFQVSPADLEGLLCSIESIADAGVTSIYDNDAGTEYPRAYLVPADQKLVSQCEPEKSGTVSDGLKKLGEQVKSWMEEKTTNYKWLRGNIVFIKEVPKSSSGKILRRMLKDTKGVEVQVYGSKPQSRGSKL